MFPRIANKEIKIDKVLQDLHVHLFTVLLSRALACRFSNVSMERKSIDIFGACSTDYHPCTGPAEAPLSRGSSKLIQIPFVTVMSSEK